jgi:hypothetical protein
LSRGGTPAHRYRRRRAAVVTGRDGAWMALTWSAAAGGILQSGRRLTIHSSSAFIVSVTLSLELGANRAGDSALGSR